MSSNSSQQQMISLQQLPPRESSLFKKILKHFKDKQFKNGLKTCNQILSNPKFSEHAETLSMKGLILNSLGKKQEAMEYVRRGLKNDVKSHVCWHVFGLLQKADHKYEEAIKCYRNALRLKKDSIQILSDLSLAQIQIRDLEGYRDSRFQLFSLRPGERSTWIGCAMAYHLTGDHMTAVNILSEYQKASSAGQNLRNRNTRRQNNEIYEHSELLLYHVFILLECKHWDEALHLLESHENDIVDKVSFYEYKCQIYLALSRFDDAQKVLLEQLIDRNPENAEYFECLEKAKQITEEEDRLKLYQEMAKLYPRSQTVSRLPLTFVTSIDVFQDHMDSYLKKGFRKGRPALFRDLKNLYRTELKRLASCSRNSNMKINLKNIDSYDQSPKEVKTLIQQQRIIKLPPKIEVIENLLMKYFENLFYSNVFDDSPNGNEESATCILWVYYFLAQHFDALKEYSMALHFANRALNHTPTLIDIFVIKAKIFKHAGLLEKAVRNLDEAQSLDTSDRYLNSKCAKYLIRINKIKEAEEMCLKFTREGVSAAENLNEMQCMWFQNEVAKAYKRLGMWGPALLKCIQVDNHFIEIKEDQFDFNTYCVLKVTLRAYIKTIRLEDHIKSHRFFINAAKTAIDIYLRLYDNPIGNKSESDNDTKTNLSASELRKLRNKQRKAMLKATAEKEADKSQRKNQIKKESDSKSDESELIDPVKLERTEDPLGDVDRFLNPVKIFGKGQVEVHMLAFEVYYRKGKILLQLQCLKRAFRCCSPKSSYYPCLLRQSLLFFNYLIQNQGQLNQVLIDVLFSELSTIEIFENLTKKGDKFDSFSKLPTIDQLIQQHLPSDSKSFLIRAENIKVKHLLEKTKNENNNNFTTNNHNNNNANESCKTNCSIEIQDIVLKMIEEMETLTQLSLEDCSEFYETLVKKQTYGTLPETICEKLRECFHTIYPLASMFMNKEQFEELEKQLSVTDKFTIEPEEADNLDVSDDQ